MKNIQKKSRAQKDIASLVKGQDGFTLIETIVAIAIFIVVLFGLVSLFDGYNTIYNSQQALVNVAGSARTVINEVQTLALPSDQVVASHTFSGVTFTSTTTTLVLELPSIDTSGNIISGKYDYAVFYVSGTKAYRLMQADNSSNRKSGLKLLSDTVNSLAFIYNNADFTKVTKVDVDIYTQAPQKLRIIKSHLHQQVYLRNI